MDPGGPPPGLGPRLPTQSAQWKESRYIVQNGEPAQLPCIRPSFRPPELVLARAGRPKLNTGAAQTGASTLNAPTGAVTAHAAIVPAGAGAISLIATYATHVIVDINGCRPVPLVRMELSTRRFSQERPTIHANQCDPSPFSALPRRSRFRNALPRLPYLMALCTMETPLRG